MDANERHLLTQLRQNPLDFGVLNDLRRHCEENQSFAVWAEALEHHARAVADADGDPVELGRLHYELGNLYRNQLDRTDDAREHYRVAFDLDAAQRPALLAARQLAAEADDWTEVADLLTREADSLPVGPKRVATLVELSKVQSDALSRYDAAEASLREAVNYTPDDLQVQHELATLLLDNADRSKNVGAATRKRREAADVLSTMARAVSDDYALAYIEAALDAMVDHTESLNLLETVAPRMGRSETLAPRWLAAIRGTQNTELARTLRLKMAGAYVAVGQLADARICLEPLLAAGDPEAHAMARRAAHSERPESDNPRDTRRESTRAKKASSAPEPEAEEELLSSEMLLEHEEPEHELEALEEQQDKPVREHDSLADQLADLSEHIDEPAARASSNPLADLAMLEQRDQRELPENEPDLLDDDEDLLDSGEALLDSREELLDSGELSTIPETSEPDSSERELPVARPTPRPSSMPPKLPSGRAAPQASLDQIAFQPRNEAQQGDEDLGAFDHDDDDADPFAEKTQPRATPLTLAELTALTGDDSEAASERVDRNIILAPQGELRGRDPDSEVTQITPAEDPQAAELRSLRTELAKRLRFRDRRGAAEVAQTLLERGVFDPGAIEALEEHFRLARDFRGLRDLSMRLANELTFPRDVRSARLREAVMLSESKLGDVDGAAAALRELLVLEPNDDEALEKLKKLLKRGQHWDELAVLLEQNAEDTDDVKARAELLRELALLQRDKRNASDLAISAFARARELDPGQLDDEVALSELYISSGRFEQAADLYEARIARLEPSQRTVLLATLSQLYEDKLHDDERAQRTLESWRAIEPRKPEPLQALIRVLERRGEHAALVSALSDQLAVASPSERLRLHVRIAEIALQHLREPGRAADSYAEAIALAPADATLWRAAAPAFEQAERVDELDELLWGLAQGGRDRALSSDLFEHLASTRMARSDLSGAIAAREAQLALTQEVGVLEALLVLLREANRPSDLSRRLDELARRSEPEAIRALRLERADVLANQLNEPEAAKSELERLLSELGSDDASALRKLVELCIATGDVKRRASSQERLIRLAPSLSARVELAVELVDIYEHELSDNNGAARVLAVWTTLEPENPTPYMRLAPLLTQAGRKRELLDTLDKLTQLANSDDEAGEFLLRAARVAMDIEDYDGAWQRLVPRVVELGDAAAERMLRELTRLAGRGEQLASLYVGLAQRDEGESDRRRWADAARVYEQELNAYDRALEAMLRALAKQLDNRELLGEVERLAGRAQAWPRLSQVYDTIVRRAEGTPERIQLLMRHARLLEKSASDQGAAFERVWLAYQLDPSLDETYGEARRLAIATKRGEELIGTYERRAQSTATREQRIDALLEACALAQHELEDTARATGYLSRAVALAGDTTSLLDTIEARVRSLDAAQPPVDGRGLLAELTGVYAQLAQENPRAPALASAWLARAARIHELKLDDPDAAFRALERASSLSPGDVGLLDELTRVTALGKNWEALAKHLQHAADVAIDSNSSSAALSRLGSLCERELASPSRAADAYEQLVRLRPKDADASRRLRHCLRASERFDELLIAIDRELFMLKPEEGKRDLLKQAAETWEFGLKNRYEALDAWKKVSALAPADPDAQAALLRLRARPRADDSLLDADLVVRPEDLRPSLIGVPASSLFVMDTAPSTAAQAPSGELFGERQVVASETDTTTELSPRDEQPAASEEHVEGEPEPTAEEPASEPSSEAEHAHDAEEAEAAHDAPFEQVTVYAQAAEPEHQAEQAPEAELAHEAEPVAQAELVETAAVVPSPESGEFDRDPDAAAEADDDDAHVALDDDELDDDELEDELEHDELDDGDLVNEVTQAAAVDLSDALPEDDLPAALPDNYDDIVQADSLTHSGSIDLSESLRDYDADVTLPLDRGEQLHKRAAAVSLEGLSSLVTRTPPPPPPPSAAKRNSSRIPPPPPRSASKPPADD